MGIIVNLANRTVQGFGFPARNDVEPAVEGVTRGGEQHTYGTIDRVTGDVYATNT